ncbi:p53-like transcription factor DNA-binding [Penicillium alfredii]|uniref:P53-like transcription factor DNA-binding n=1 Tax=Penicillium alfredii TaxID=1506179 RepID=A0A9W9KGG2_9EURO|nr:p53-like transcription factor DNA-binding [Penicillium alfredii]KAJ5105555.1 p53-like transcription factor DNA-binding [Penicillium alfredii]
MDCPVTSDGSYISSHVTGFPTEDDNQRVGALASMPVTNGVRYHAQPAMHDLQFILSHHWPHVLAFASATLRQTSGFPACSRSPPVGMSNAMQMPSHTVNSVPDLIARNHAYSTSSYAVRRGMAPLTGMNDVSRSYHYSGTPRILENAVDRGHNGLFQHPVSETPQRSQQTQVEAPPFEETSVLESIVAELGGAQQTIKPELLAKMGRGFFPFEGRWTCYRRNYFSVNCSFLLHPFLSNVPLYIRMNDQSLERIFRFSMAISAIVNGQYGETRELVQHTPKRDKQSERKPERVILQPSPPASLTANSTGNGTHTGFSLGSQSLDYNSSFAGAPQPCQPPTSHMFERIQFQKATANNGKRRAQQQCFNVVVELHAEIAGPVAGETQWVQVARRLSHPMVVRGRSPGHYKDSRRDSTASMGPDGSSGDGSAGNLPPVLGQPGPPSHLFMYDSSSHRSGVPYGRADYRQMAAAEHSPLSDSPLISSASSSGFDYTMMNETMDPMDTIKPTSTTDPYQDPTFAGITSSQPRHSGSGGYHPVYSTYGRYDPIQHSLCT